MGCDRGYSSAQVRCNMFGWFSAKYFLQNCDETSVVVEDRLHDAQTFDTTT